MLQRPKARLCSLFWSTTDTMSTIELCDITTLLGIFLFASKHQNSVELLKHPIDNKTTSSHFNELNNEETRSENHIN